MTQHTKLMIPGPVDIWDETLKALSEPVRVHYGEEWAPIYKNTIAMVKKVFQTKNDIVIMTSPGSGAIDTAIGSLFSPGDKVAVVDNGPFARRLVQLLNSYKIQVVAIEHAWGTAGDADKMRDRLKRHRKLDGIAVVANDTGTGVRNPVEDYAALAHELNVPIFVDAVSAIGGYNLPVDKWDLDVVVTSSNKALEIPPGLGILSVSKRAWAIIKSKSKQAAHRGWYYDLQVWKNAMDSDANHPYPTTQGTSLIYALQASLERILKVETLRGHWARYAWSQRVIRAGLRSMGFEMIVPDDCASYTVTTFKVPKDMKSQIPLRDHLLHNEGILIATGFGQFAKDSLRLGHMGKAGSRDYIVPCLLGIEDFMRKERGLDIPHGSSLLGLKKEKRWY